MAELKIHRRGLLPGARENHPSPRGIEYNRVAKSRTKTRGLP
jgi:hypothetical protein